jgi:hypothetical protein
MMNGRTLPCVTAVLVAALCACKKDKTEVAPAASVAASAAQVEAKPAAPPKSAEPSQPTAPPLPPDGIPDIPAEKSAPPTVAEWAAAPEVNTQGANSRPEGCYMKVCREWLKVHCDGAQYYDWNTLLDIPPGGGHLDGTNYQTRFGVLGTDWFYEFKQHVSYDTIIRLRRGKDLKLEVLREPSAGGGSALLFMSWPSGKPKPSIIALGKSGNWKEHGPDK